MTLKRGKWLLSRTLLNRQPLVLGQSVIAVDAVMERFHLDGTWDVFLLVEKTRR